MRGDRPLRVLPKTLAPQILPAVLRK